MNDKLQLYLSKPWLYQLGLEILSELAPEHPQLTKLQSYTAPNEKTLLLIVKNISSKINSVEQRKAKSLPAPVETPKVDDVQITPEVFQNSFFNEDIDRLKKEKAKLFSEASNAHHELTSMKLSQKQRLIRAEMIVSNLERVDEIWFALDYFEANGKLPLKEVAPNDYEMAMQTAKRITTLRTYISKYSKLVAEVKTGKAKTSHEEKLKKFQFELNQLQNAN